MDDGEKIGASICAGIMAFFLCFIGFMVGPSDFFGILITILKIFGAVFLMLSIAGSVAYGFFKGLNYFFK